MSAPHTSELVVVTKGEFFAYVGPRDIHPRAERNCSVWQTREQVMVGKTTPGYANGWTSEGKAPDVYMLTPAAHAAHYQDRRKAAQS